MQTELLFPGTWSCFSQLWASLVAQTVKNRLPMQERWVPSLGRDDPPEEGVATHSSIFCLGSPMDGEGVVDYGLWSCKESDTTERLKQRQQHF